MFGTKIRIYLLELGDRANEISECVSLAHSAKVHIPRYNIIESRSASHALRVPIPIK